MKLITLTLLCASGLLLNTGCASSKKCGTQGKPAMACDGSCCSDHAKCAACCKDAEGCAKCCHKS